MIQQTQEVLKRTLRTWWHFQPGLLGPKKCALRVSVSALSRASSELPLVLQGAAGQRPGVRALAYVPVTVPRQHSRGSSLDERSCAGPSQRVAHLETPTVFAGVR